MNRPLRVAFRSLMIGFTTIVILFVFADFNSRQSLALSTRIAQQHQRTSSDIATVRVARDTSAPPRSTSASSDASVHLTASHSTRDSTRPSRQTPSHVIDPAPVRHSDITNNVASNDASLPPWPRTADPRPTSSPVTLGRTIDAVERTTVSERSGESISEPARSPSPRRPRTEIPVIADSGKRLEVRLIDMQRQLNQLAQNRQEEQIDSLQRATQLLQQNQQANLIQQLTQQLKLLQPGAPAASTPPPLTVPSQTVPAAKAPEAASAPDSGKASSGTQPILSAQPTSDDPERFDFQFQDADIKETLAMLGELAGINILVGNGVTGTVPAANLKNVSVEEALHAILKSVDYVFQREDDFIFVMTKQEAEQRATAQEQEGRQVVSKVYRPHYISAKDLQSLIVPLQSPTVGQIAITAANEVGIAFDAESAGGDQLAQQDAVVVVDYQDVILEIDKLVAELDVPPPQVVIEAMILSVTLDDTMEFGVNFALLSGSADSLGVVGNGQVLANTSGFPGDNDSMIPIGAGFKADSSGLKWGMIRGDVSVFINALEKIADTNLVAAPQLRVVNKQKAELIIGDKLSYKTLSFNGTQTVENVNFLDVGTKLVMRPFISPDGRVRLEVHPERSSGAVDQDTGLPNQRTTEVTTNVMVRDGTTIVIGGLIEEQVEDSQSRVPLLGAIPVVGTAFRDKTERVKRTEMIVLITPRIVDDETDAFEGETLMSENEERADYFRNNLSMINRRNLSRIARNRAQDAFERGEYDKAESYVNRALYHSKNDMNALRLRDQIDAAKGRQRRQWMNWSFLPKGFRMAPATEFTDPQEANTDGTSTTQYMPPTPAPASTSP